MATAMSTTPYTGYPTSHHHHQSAYRPAPPSPPMEHAKCTLPSISNLIGLADAGSPTHENAPASRDHSPRSEVPPRRLSGPRAESRPSSGYAKAFPHHHHHHQRAFPPSPPMSTDASLESASPSHKPSLHFPVTSAPQGYYHETTPPLESDLQRHYADTRSQQQQQQQSLARHPMSTSPTSQSSAGSYFPPVATPSAPRQPAPQAQTPGMAYQRPLPQSFPPAPVSAPVGVAPSPGAISWQHHHYLSPAPGHLFPQSQDRYICPTCNKAFSRPSSLRIHSHSHTGEKPFKCSQAGCGKAFSVRSNMKRHERGCHSVEVKTGGPGLL